jgi:N-acetylglucosaminyl-diphospho-decaprenol L-rhamnosyltransferase
MTTGVTAIVVTYNSAGQIGRALTALRGADVDVVVVDNASADATRTIVQSDFPDVALLVNATNVGFATAVNQGLADVRAGVVLLVNPDCTVPADTVRGLVHFLATRPDVGVAGPRVLDADGRVAVSAHPFESLTSVLVSRFGGSLVPVGVRRILSGSSRRRMYDACRGPAEPTPVDWLSGACLAVRADLLHATGGLDERYFLYYEDEELCWQAHSLGLAVIYLPELQVVHIGGASSAVGATWPHLYRSMLIFFAEHRRSSYQAVRFTVLARAGLGIALATARRATGSESGAARAAAWRGVARVAWTSGRPDRVSRPELEGAAA